MDWWEPSLRGWGRLIGTLWGEGESDRNSVLKDGAG